MRTVSLLRMRTCAILLFVYAVLSTPARASETKVKPVFPAEGKQEIELAQEAVGEDYGNRNCDWHLLEACREMREVTIPPDISDPKKLLYLKGRQNLFYSFATVRAYIQKGSGRRQQPDLNNCKVPCSNKRDTCVFVGWDIAYGDKAEVKRPDALYDFSVEAKVYRRDVASGKDVFVATLPLPTAWPSPGNPSTPGPLPWPTKAYEDFVYVRVEVKITKDKVEKSSVSLGHAIYRINQANNFPDIDTNGDHRRQETITDRFSVSSGFELFEKINP